MVTKYSKSSEGVISINNMSLARWQHCTTGCPAKLSRFVYGNILASIAPSIKMLDIFMEPIQY